MWNRWDRFAVISDVHGNRWALEAVLADIQDAGVSQVVNLGDVLYGPLDPRGTAEILMARSIPTVKGNEDRLILEEHAMVSDTLAFVRDQLRPGDLEWLTALPAELLMDGIYLCHASPESDSSYLLWDVGEDGASRRSPAELASSLTGLSAELILCGHDHVPGTVHLDGGPMVVNPGSVGLPAYWDDAPHAHVMETGTHHARYSILTRDERGWQVDEHAVSYEWQAAVREAGRNCRPDWAEWLATGQAKRGE